MPSKFTGRITGGGVTPVPILYGPIKDHAKGSVMFAPAHIAHQVLVGPTANDPDGYVLAQTGGALPSAASTVDLPRAGVLAVSGPAHPRNVVVTVTHAAAIVACSGTIYGTDVYGAAITATWAVTATGTSKTSTSAVAFASVSRVTLTCEADVQANTVTVGTGKVFGLEFVNACPSAVKEMQDATVVTNGVFVAASAVANADSRGTYTPNADPDSLISFGLWYLVNNLRTSA